MNKKVFKKIVNHLKTGLFGLHNTLPKTLQHKAKQSIKYVFYIIIFRKIDEEIFSVLYADKVSRPNPEVNSLVSALQLISHRQWIYKELFTQMEFNILIKLVFSISALEEQPFSSATVKKNCRMTNEKLKVREAFRSSLFAFNTVLAINDARIYLLLTSYDHVWTSYSNFLINILEQQRILLSRFVNLIKSNNSCNLFPIHE